MSNIDDIVGPDGGRLVMVCLHLQNLRNPDYNVVSVIAAGLSATNLAKRLIHRQGTHCDTRKLDSEFQSNLAAQRICRTVSNLASSLNHLRK